MAEESGAAEHGDDLLLGGAKGADHEKPPVRRGLRILGTNVAVRFRMSLVKRRIPVKGRRDKKAHGDAFSPIDAPPQAP
jgi:hypothetical protein